MPHLVPQVAQHVLVALALDQAGALFLVHLQEHRVGQVEGDPDRDRALRDTPFVGEIEGRLELHDSARAQLGSEALDHLLEGAAFDLQVEVADALAEDLLRDVLLAHRLERRRIRPDPGGALGNRELGLEGTLRRGCFEGHWPGIVLSKTPSKICA